MPQTTITADTVVRRASDLSFSSADEKTILLNMAKNRFHGMNKVGSRIWELLAAPLQVSELCDRLQTEFEVAPEECLADVVSFLASMQADGLITGNED